MIAFFRRSLNNKLALAILSLVLLAFVITGAVTREVGGGLALGTDRVASVGGDAITTADAAKRVRNAIDSARQQNPQLDAAGFVAQGGVEQVIDQMVADQALETFARKNGIAASDRLVEGEIASIGAFKGPTGKFDPTQMRNLLAQKGISERDLRADIASEAIGRQMLIPASGAARVPVGLVTPYASLLLETREGLVGAVPVDKIPGGPPPSDAEIAAFYKANSARYIVPERRALRYAFFGAEQAKPSAPPSDAEIAKFYAANAASYAAKETRTLAQVILPDQAAAQAFAAKVKGGAGFVDAAKAAGFTPADIAVGEVSRAQYANKASDAVAAAAFAAQKGDIAGPVKADLGWYVVQVQDVKGTPAKPLSAVRDEIAAAIQRQKTDEALTQMAAAVDDAISGGSSFDDVARSEKLAVTITPALLPDGSTPDDPSWRPTPETPLLMKTAAGMSTEDQPTVVTIGAGQRYALLSVAKVVPAAPAPLDRIKDKVAADIVAKRRADVAKRIADGILAAVKKGKPLAVAMAEAKMPPPQPAKARQLDLSQARQAPPPLTLLFAMRSGDTKLLPAQANAGWYVVQLARITPGDARTRPDLVSATQSEFVKLVGNEYAEQLAKAAQKAVGVKRDQAAIAKLKAGFVGGQGGQ